MTSYTNTNTSTTPKNAQAPIDLNNKLVRRMRFPPLILNGHWLKDGNAILFNNGKTAMIYLGGDRIPSTVYGGPLKDEYEFHDAHFHWGENDSRGAEHTIDGTWFTMECHLVHWNKRYLTFEECLKYQDGLCVLAYLFLVHSGSCKCSNVKFEGISKNLKYIQNTGSEIQIPANSLSWMQTATDSTNYYTYHGSYNVDPHPECVTWIVFPVIIPIQSRQSCLVQNGVIKNRICMAAPMLAVTSSRSFISIGVRLTWRVVNTTSTAEVCQWNCTWYITTVITQLK
ncbi:carbonic anhydrase 3 isoform X2 [Monomorium pharaonis]|uniref:carbonic anhydrase 3 isoform X2 n=1 Tax=Monomorium pharaonis TaxID=307658 RepID=UPI0017468EA3|nr:carbonic anhydrase 3 isoform X2 [Monomorium pharaonis]